MRAVDEAILRAVNGMHNPALDGAARWLSEWGMYVCLAALVALAARTRAPRDVAHARDGALTFFAAVFLAETVLKPLVGRARPTADATLAAQLHLLGPRPPASSLSFPSGTATACCAVAAYVWLAWGRRAGVPAALFAAMVSLSRVYAGLHWPSDLVGGAAVGAALAWAVWALSRWVERRAMSPQG